MHAINLSNFSIRTDLIIDHMSSNKYDGVIHNKEKVKDILIDEFTIPKELEATLNKKAGIYKTISFKDVTDKDNYKLLEEVFINEMKSMLENCQIKDNNMCLVVGLGNDKSTPDALGPKVIDNVLVTKYLFDLGEVEDGYRNVCSFTPSVTGVTGIETSDIIDSLINTVKPDFVIVIDALASSTIDRLNKTIQITNTGINPGSGVGNSRKEISKETQGIPVIAIGVPTIVDAVTIVSDTIHYMLKQFSYKIDNIDNQMLKMIHVKSQNYKDHETNLSSAEKEELLGLVGSLNDEELRSLIDEVLSPINYNLMVTPKEIDFVLEKLSLLIGNGINKSLHKVFNPTN